MYIVVCPSKAQIYKTHVISCLRKLFVHTGPYLNKTLPHQQPNYMSSIPSYSINRRSQSLVQCPCPCLWPFFFQRDGSKHALPGHAGDQGVQAAAAPLALDPGAVRSTVWTEPRSWQNWPPVKRKREPVETEACLGGPKPEKIWQPALIEWREVVEIQHGFRLTHLVTSSLYPYMFLQLDGACAYQCHPFAQLLRGVVCFLYISVTSRNDETRAVLSFPYRASRISEDPEGLKRHQKHTHTPVISPPNVG